MKLHLPIKLLTVLLASLLVTKPASAVENHTWSINVSSLSDILTKYESVNHEAFAGYYNVYDRKDGSFELKRNSFNEPVILDWTGSSFSFRFYCERVDFSFGNTEVQILPGSTLKVVDFFASGGSLTIEDSKVSTLGALGFDSFSVKNTNILGGIYEADSGVFRAEGCDMTYLKFRGVQELHFTGGSLSSSEIDMESLDIVEADGAAIYWNESEIRANQFVMKNLETIFDDVVSIAPKNKSGSLCRIASSDVKLRSLLEDFTIKGYDKLLLEKNNGFEVYAATCFVDNGTFCYNDNNVGMHVRDSLEISGNDRVEFSGNSNFSADGNGWTTDGCTIWTDSFGDVLVDIRNNGDVLFLSNIVGTEKVIDCSFSDFYSSDRVSDLHGAISFLYGRNSMITLNYGLNISGNKQVVFNGNYTIYNSQLVNGSLTGAFGIFTGIKVFGGSTYISAPAGGNVIFFDPLRIEGGSLLALNRNVYGTVGDGDVYFSGRTVVSNYCNLGFNEDFVKSENFFPLVVGSHLNTIRASIDISGGRVYVQDNAMWRVYGSNIWVRNKAALTLEPSRIDYIAQDGSTVWFDCPSLMNRWPNCRLTVESGSVLALTNLSHGSSTIPVVYLDGSLVLDKGSTIRIDAEDSTATIALIYAKNITLDGVTYRPVVGDIWTSSTGAFNMNDLENSPFWSYIECDRKEDLRWISGVLYLYNNILYYDGDDTLTNGASPYDIQWATSDTYAQTAPFSTHSKLHFEKTPATGLLVDTELPHESINVNLKDGKDGEVTYVSSASATGGAPYISFSKLQLDNGVLTFKGAGYEVILSGSEFTFSDPEKSHVVFSNASSDSLFNVRLANAEITAQASSHPLMELKTEAANSYIEVDFGVQTANGVKKPFYAGVLVPDFAPYQAWVNRINNSDPSFSGSRSQAFFICDSNLYYGNQKGFSMLSRANSPWWDLNASGSVRCEYDTEKIQGSSGSSAGGGQDGFFCYGCVAANMFASWADRYAPLNYATDSQASSMRLSPVSGGSVYADPFVLNRNDSYDALMKYYYWKNPQAVSSSGGSVEGVLRDLLVSDAFGGAYKSLFGQPPPLLQMDSAAFLSKVSPDNLQSLNGSITQISFAHYGQNAGGGPADKGSSLFSNVNDVSSAVSASIIRAFEIAPDTPVALSECPVDPNGGYEKLGHVLTCWGYQTSCVNIDGVDKEIVTALKVTDSDDGSASGTTAWLNVIYSGGSAFLVRGDSSQADTSQKLQSAVYALRYITVLVPPANAEALLAAYYNPDTEIYWTGNVSRNDKGRVGQEWLVDNSVFVFNQSREIIGQNRLADVSDGWSKICSVGSSGTMTHTVFTGKEKTVVFCNQYAADVNKKRVVYTRGIDASGTEAKVQGDSFQFYAIGSGVCTITLAKLEVDGCISASAGQGANAPTLTLGSGIAINAPVSLVNGAYLLNYGTLEQGCSLQSKTALASGKWVLCNAGVQDAKAIGDGLYVTGNSGITGGLDVSAGATLIALVDCSSAGVMTVSGTAGYSQKAVDPSIGAPLFGVPVENGAGAAYLLLFTGLQVRDDANAVLGDASIQAFNSDVELLGKADRSIMVGSVGGKADSTADIRFAAVDGVGSNVRALESSMATSVGERVWFTKETSVSAYAFTVSAGSSLTNDGVLSVDEALVVEGTLAGSGRFGKTLVGDGGTVIAGQGGAAAQYEALTVQDGGRLAIVLDGGSSVDSTCPLHLTGEAGLTVEGGAHVSILMSPDCFNWDKLGTSQRYGVLSMETSPTGDLACGLQSATDFSLISFDGTESDLEVSGLQVRRYEWVVEDDGTLALNVTAGYIHHSELCWNNYSGDSSWNTVSSNWDGEASPDGVFSYGYTCKFTDAGAGTVTLVGDLDPDSVIVDAGADYVFAGDGGLIGSVSITKLGAGALVVETDNSHSGGTVLESGILRLGHVHAAGSGAIELRGGTLDVGGLAVHNNIDVRADDAVRLLQAGNYAGVLHVHSGTLSLTGDLAGTLVLEAGSTLDASAVAIGSLSLGEVRLEGEGGVNLDFGDLRKLHVGEVYDLFTMKEGAARLDASLFSLVNSGLRDGMYTLCADGGRLSFTLDVAPFAILEWTGAKGVWCADGDKTWSLLEGEPGYNRFRNGDAVSFSSKATVTINGGVKPGGVTVDVQGKDALTFVGKGSITGSGSLTMDGTGTLKLNAANAYSGGTVINAGTVTATGATSFGSGVITLNGGTLNLGGKAVANDINASGGLLSGAGKYAGSLTVDGALEVKSTAHANVLTLVDGSLKSGTIKDTAITLKSGSITSAISGKSSVLVTGEAALTGKLSYTGGTTLAGGTLTSDFSLAAKQTLTATNGSFGGNLTLSGGSILLADDMSLTVSNALVLKKASTLDVSSLDGSATISFASLTGDTTKFLKLSAPTEGRKSYEMEIGDKAITVTASGTNTDLTWNAPKGKGKWEVAGKQTWDGSTDDNRFYHGDNVTFNAAASVTLATKLAPGSVTVTGDGAVTFSGSGSIAGDAKLTMNGSNTLKLNATNTYTGGTTINSGTVIATGVDSFGNGDIKLSGGTLNLSKKAVKNSILVEGTATILNAKGFAGTITVADGATLSLTDSLTGTLVLNGGTLDLSGVKNIAKMTFGTVICEGETDIVDASGQHYTFDGNKLVKDGRLIATAPAPQPQIPGAAIYTTQMRAQIDGNRAAFDSIRQMMGCTQPTTADGKYRFAVQATNANSHQDGYDRNGFGGLVMAEQVFSDKAVGGLSLGYEHADIRPDGADKYESDDTRVNAHLLVSTKHWQSRSIAGVGIHDYRINRSSAVSTGRSLNLMQEVSRTIALDDRNIVSPFVRVETGYNVIGSCNDGALTVGKQHAWATDITFGARYVHGFRYGTLMLEAGATKSIGDLGGNVTVNNTALTPADAKRWSATLGGSVQIPVGKRSSINAGASVHLHGGATEVNANVGYSIKF